MYISLVCGSKKIAEFCVSEEEYETLGESKPGDVVIYSIVATAYNDGSSMRMMEIRRERVISGLVAHHSPGDGSARHTAPEPAPGAQSEAPLLITAHTAHRFRTVIIIITIR